jgi:hypothetical protein
VVDCRNHSRYFKHVRLHLVSYVFVFKEHGRIVPYCLSVLPFLVFLVMVHVFDVILGDLYGKG